VALTEKTTHLLEALARLPEQFKGNVEMREMLRTWVRQVQDFETAAFEVINGRGITDGVGVQLDGIGQIVGQERGGADDATYRLRLRAKILLNMTSGTIPEILEIFALLIAEDQTPDIVEYFPAALKLRIVGDSGTPSVTATELNKFLQRARAAGVRANLVYSTEPTADTFTWDGTADQGWDVGEWAHTVI
jgi:hypothetical protein